MKYFLFCACFLSSYFTQAQKIDARHILDDVKALSDDAFKGRGTGSGGEKAASVYIEKEFKKLGLQPAGDSKTYLQAFPFNSGVHGEGAAGIAANVVGFLDNKADKTVIIGAHYDHLGIDGQGSSLEANPDNKIHNGADDNASGVAGVLELARYFANNKKKENTNFLFLCFSGEELGLLGSKYFTDHSPVDLQTANFMINLDMIGRLDAKTRLLIVNGTGTSPVWEPLLRRLNANSFLIKTDSSGTGPSDHTSFYLKDIPVLHFFTGSHSDYHKPSDDWEKVNTQGEAEVVAFIVKIIENLDTEPKIAFLKTKSKAQAGRSSFKVTLGIMPSYSGGGDGLKVDGVTDEKAAHKAGILTGDVIIQLGDYTINDIYGYMEALNRFQKGQTVPVRIKRGEEVITVQVTF